MDRNAINRSQQERKRIGRRAQSTEAVEFFNVLTSPELLETIDAQSPEHRERLYPPTVTLSMFMGGVSALTEHSSLSVNGTLMVNFWGVLH